MTIWRALVVPPPRVLGRAAMIVLAAGLVVVVVWAVTDEATALAVYKGMIAMIIAITQLTTRRQLALAALAAVAAGVGVAVGGTLWLLCLAVAAACLLQWLTNRWTVATAAVLPALLVGSAGLATAGAVRIALATLFGAVVAMALARTLPHRAAAEPVDPISAGWHAAALTVGCVALVVANAAAGFPHGVWAVAALCLVFLPSIDATRTRVVERVLGTVAGAAVAAVVAAVAPTAVCLALAAVLGVLVVAYALTGHNVLSVVFMTPTVLLAHGVGRFGRVVDLAGERVLMTVLAGATALALGLILTRLPNRYGNARSQ